MRRRLLLWGAGGHALSLTEALRRHGRSVAAYAVEAGQPARGDLTPLLRGEADLRHWLASSEPSEFLIAIGLLGEVRRRVAADADRLGLAATKFCDGTAVVAGGTMLEEGSQVFPLAYLGPGASVGRHSIINVGAVIEHDSTVGAFSDVAPCATLLGGAKIGARVLIGANATVLPGITVCDDVVVGSGAVVTRDIETPGTYVGMPARATAKD